MKNSFTKILVLFLAILIIGVVIWYIEMNKTNSSYTNIEKVELGLNSEEKSQKYDPAIEIVNPSGFINTDPITIAELIGKKVILVDFWTYSCINCQRTLPHLTTWYDKYHDQGLEIISIHTPEFEFEKNYDNVLAATKRFGVKYPVIMDNDYGTWYAYDNHYWPHKYLIDIDGYIVYDHIGEGGYEETESVIQDLLTERAEVLGEEINVSDILSSANLNDEVNFYFLGSQETYFGSARNDSLVNGKAGRAGEQTLSQPKKIKLNDLNLVGTWNIDTEYAENKTSGASIIYRYKANKVFLVMSSEKANSIQVLVDGQPAGELAGEDLVESSVEVQESRLYRLIKDPNGYNEHTLELVISDPGLKVYAFTFG